MVTIDFRLKKDARARGPKKNVLKIFKKYACACGNRIDDNEKSVCDDPIEITVDIILQRYMASLVFLELRSREHELRSSEVKGQKVRS